jgi:site-specific DNA-methyltransferase (adenine-specific)
MSKIELIHGDCLEKMKDISDKSIDMVLCDLPYGTTQNKWDFVIPFEPMWEQFTRVTKENSAIVLFGSQPFTSALVMSNVQMFKYEWIWVKNNATGHLNAKRKPMSIFEDVLVFSFGSPVYNPQGLVPFNKKVKRGHNGNNYGVSGKENFQEFTNYPLDILCFDTDTNKLHPTQKPVALLEYLIKTYTTEGENVLDNCMGSGSTGVACKNTNRNFIGIERELEYFKIAEKRIYENNQSI